jgi:hypothetical protein
MNDNVYGYHMSKPHSSVGRWVRDRKTGKVGIIVMSRWRQSMSGNTTTLTRVFVLDIPNDGYVDADMTEVDYISALEAMSL